MLYSLLQIKYNNLYVQDNMNCFTYFRTNNSFTEKKTLFESESCLPVLKVPSTHVMAHQQPGIVFMLSWSL